MVPDVIEGEATERLPTPAETMAVVVHGASVNHGCDEECIAAGTVDPATGDCTACGVTGCRNDDGTVCPPCGSCDGERFHRAGCPDSDDGQNMTVEECEDAMIAERAEADRIAAERTNNERSE